MNRLAYKLIFKEWSLDLNITRLYVYSQPQKNRRGVATEVTNKNTSKASNQLNIFYKLLADLRITYLAY